MIDKRYYNKKSLNKKSMVREKESTKGIEFHEIKMNEFIISDKR